jgi:1,4-dihydroxy-2-naphthoyl-CoA hydrolase
MLNQSIPVELLNKNSANSMGEHLGIEVTEVGKDYICGKMPVDNRTRQPFGLLHGGASVVLAESLGSLGANLVIDMNTQYCVGLEINANHVRSVREGYVFGKATIVHAGKTTQIWDIRITDTEANLVCISRLTMAVLKK